MSSVFGGSEADFSLSDEILIAGTTYVPTATSTTTAIVGLDTAITLTPTVQQPYILLADAINGLAETAFDNSSNFEPSTIKDIYESNPDTNAFTDAYKTTLDNIGTYIDASELAASQSAQDSTISATYKTISSFNSDISSYRTSSAEDVINATKLNTADLISDIIPHPSSPGDTFNGTLCCGYVKDGTAHTTPSTITPILSDDPVLNGGIDQYDTTYNYCYFPVDQKNYIGTIYLNSKGILREQEGTYENIAKATVFGSFSSVNETVRKWVTNGSILVGMTNGQTSATCVPYSANGTTWNQLDLTPHTAGCTLTDILIDTADNLIFITSDIGIFKCTTSFTSLTFTAAPAHSIVKISTGNYLVFRFNGMKFWDLSSFTNAASSPSNIGIADTDGCDQMTYGPNDYIYALTRGTDNRSLWRSTDAGNNWSVFATLNSDYVFITALYYSTGHSRLFVSGNSTSTPRFTTVDTLDNIVDFTHSYNGTDGAYYTYGFGDQYIGGGGSGVNVTLNAGTSNTTNVYDTLIDLSTANTEVRAAGYITSSALAPYITSATAASTYYLQTNPAGYQTASNVSTALSPYITSSAAASTYYLQTNPAGYQTASDVSTALSVYSTTSQMNTAITNSQNTQDSSIASTYITQANAASTYKTISSFNSDIASYLTSATAASTYATLLQLSYLARTNVKVVQLTNSSTTPSPGQAYSTIASALAAASSGQIVFVMPGTYNESSLTLPAGVELRGLSRFSCIISATPTTSTTVMTIGGANCKMTDISIISTSTTNGANQTGVSISSTYNTTFFMRNCNITINGLIGDTDTANAICLDSTATSSHSNDSVFNYIDCVLQVSANANGVKRCVRSTGAGSDLHFDTCQFSCLRSSAGADYIAFEVNNASADSQLTNCYLSGYNNDISATAGIIQLGKSTILANSTTNGKSVLVFGGDTTYVASNEGIISAGTSYISFGGNYTGNEKRLYLPRKCVVYGLTYSNRLSTSSDNTVLTVRKNGVDTALTLNMTAASTYGTNTTSGVTFNSGDYLSVSIVRGTGTITDTNIQFSTY